MKLRKAVSVVVLAAICVLPHQAAVLAADNYAAWAAPYVHQADELGLLTEKAKKDYVKALTREEFCELVVTMYEKRTGNQVAVTSRPFTDTTNQLVLKAYSLGIVNGTSATTFSPNNPVTREQAAVMLVNAVRKIEQAQGVKIYTQYADTLPFQDSGSISTWALEAMKVAYANGLMQGDGTNVRPLANISCQECIILIINAYNKEDAAPQDLGGLAPGTTTGPVPNVPPGQQAVTPPATDTTTTTTTSTSAGPLSVVVDGGNIPLKVNETTQLSYSLTGEAEISGISWSSSAPSVATIDQNGNVKAIGKGNTKITLTVTTNVKTITGTKTIYVDPPLVALNSVAITQPVRTIKYGDTSTFNVQLSPSTASVDSVTWSSSNTGVATIDSKGKATSVAAGTTTIKVAVKAKDGTIKEATATLTVTAPIAINSIKFGSSSSDPMFVGTTRTVSATIGPTGSIATTKTWSSSSTSVAVVDKNGKISAIAAGTTIIKLETTDRTGSKFSNSFSLTVKDNYTSSFTLGKSSYTLGIGETIYPELNTSPATAVIKTVSFSFSPSGAASVNSTSRSITGKKEGSGVLTVKVTFEDKTSHTAQANITVQPMPVDTVSFTASKTVLKVNGKSTEGYVNASYRITPSNASYESITFSSSNTSVATVANTSSNSASGSRKIEAISPGNCTITMTIKFSNGATRTESLSITVIE
ncbi:MAG: Ig-like domain-containing protein [Clostridiales bacterium]|nr:Ig-like domain-containing protein [Clostridiales bacterium]